MLHLVPGQVRVADYLTVGIDPGPGKKLSAVRMTASFSLYLADLGAEGRRISNPSRLTTIDGWNSAPVWDVDSQAIFFASNRDGLLQIFKQPYSGDSAQPTAGGPGSASVPVMTPGGSFLLYVTPAYAMVGGSATPVQLMRVPRDGVAPQPVLTAHLYDSPRCARAPANLCAIAEPTQDRKQMIFTAFDPVQGRGRELTRIEVDPNADYGWDLSPDGARIAVLKRVSRSDGKIFSSEGHIHILSLNGEPPREIHVKGVTSEYVDWAANGRG